MCDYSLEQVASRSAKLADQLVVTSFGLTRGFAAAEERGVAVCLRPGTEIAFDDDVAVEDTGGFLGRLEHRIVPGRVARFRQVNIDQPCTHHDAVEFADGTTVLLTRLSEGQRATVLQLPVSPDLPHAGPAYESTAQRVWSPLEWVD